MPAKVTSDFSFTANVGGPLWSLISFDEMWTWLLSFNPIKLALVGEKASFEHYHAAIVLSGASRTDKFKEKILKSFKDLLISKGFEWTTDNDAYAVKCKSHHDINGLAGGYMTKAVEGGSRCIGFDPAELERGKERRDVAIAEKLKKLPVSESALMGLLKDAFDNIRSRVGVNAAANERWMLMPANEKLQLMEKILISDGYDLSKVFSGVRRKYVLKNFHDYFEPEPVSRIINEFFDF